MDEVFVAAIVGEPGEPLHCHAYADHLDERDASDLAEAYRWMGRTGKRPHRRERYAPCSTARNGRAVPADVSWGWYRTPTPGYRGKDFDPPAPAAAYLPRTIFAAITSADHHYSDSWQSAVLAFALALARARADVEGTR